MTRRPQALHCLLLGGATLLLFGCDIGQRSSLLPMHGSAGTSSGGSAGMAGTVSGGSAGMAGSVSGGSAGSAGSASSCQVLADTPPPPLLDCSSAAKGEAPVLDDFDDGDLILPSKEQRVGSWYTFTDGTAGCAKLQVEAAEPSKALHFTGSGFSNWGAAFGVALAWSLEQQGLCTYDLSAYSGIRFRARGNATVRMNIASRAAALQSVGGDCPDSDGCFDHQGRNVALSSEFREIELPFCSLSQRGFGPPLGQLDRAQTTNVNFLVQSTNAFDVWIDDIDFIPWREGQARDCSTVCPTDELALGITPRPGETTIDQEATGVRLFTFEQRTKSCGALTRRYLSYIPKSLEPATNAPVLIALHGLGSTAEVMRDFITHARFETLAERDHFIVVYGNAAPGVGTVPERPNGGGFRKDLSGNGQVDDFAYLQNIIDDLTARGAISGKNPVFLTGLSDGGGLTHLAALHDPTRYRGIAALMPYPGETVAMPTADAGFTLKRVLLGYSILDPGMAPGYAELLAPLGPAWAAALALSSEDQAAPRKTALPDLVDEGASYQGTDPKVLLTRNSHGEQVDYGTNPAAAQVRVVSFDHAGHLWPVPAPTDRPEEMALFGLRNQDVDMSDVVWDFFKSCL